MPRLDWPTRDDDLQTAKQNPLCRLEEDLRLSHGERACGNLLIQGDNRQALAALLPAYRGQVKCVFIDPPYNTQAAFDHYDDHREHAQWLAMIHPRLALLRELMSEQATIWVAIDDNEGPYLKVLMDEVFGRRNFIASPIWVKTSSVHNNAEFFSSMHDTIHVYGRNVRHCAFGRVPRSERNASDYANPDDDARGAWSSSPLHVSLSSGQRGSRYAATGTSTGLYPIINPHGQAVFPPPGRAWAYSAEAIARFEAERRIHWGASGRNQPRLKRFLADAQTGVVPTTVWHHTEVGHNQEAKKEIASLSLSEGSGLFSTPKPERLLQRILAIASSPGDLVLDCFLGSGTTAAVAHKMDRRYIGIEIGGHAVSHCAARLRKVIAGEQGGISAAVGWQGGGGFCFYRLAAPLPAVSRTGDREPG